MYYNRIVLFTENSNAYKNLGNIVIIESKKSLNLLEKFKIKLENCKSETEKRRFLSDIYIQNTFEYLNKKINQKISYIIINPHVDEIGFNQLIQLLDLTNIICCNNNNNNKNLQFLSKYKKIIKNVNSIKEMVNVIINSRISNVKDEKYKFLNYVPYFTEEKDIVFNYLEKMFISVPYKIFDCSKNHKLNKTLYVPGILSKKQALIISCGGLLYFWFIDELCLYRVKKDLGIDHLAKLISNCGLIPMGNLIIMNDTVIFYITGYTGRFDVGDFMQFSLWFENEAKNSLGIITISKTKYNLYYINNNIHIYVPKLLKQNINLDNDDNDNNLDIDLFKYNIFYDLKLNEKIKK